MKSLKANFWFRSKAWKVDFDLFLDYLRNQAGFLKVGEKLCGLLQDQRGQSGSRERSGQEL